MLESLTGLWLGRTAIPLRQVAVCFLCVSAVLLAACGSPSPTAPTSPPLAIASQPQDQAVPYGGTATLMVAAQGAEPMTYQWHVGERGNTAMPVAGATAASYTTPALTTTTRFWARVSDPTGQLVSATATITVAPQPDGTPPAAAPKIVEPPEGVTVSSGEKATLFVEVTGAEPITYQWFEESSTGDTSAIDGAITATLVTPALSVSTAYWVRVANPLGSVDSATAVVTVAGPPTPGPTPPPPVPPPTPPPSSIVLLNDDLGGRPLFPPSNWWNQDISRAPVDSNSAAFINFIGRTRRLHPDFGPPPYGIPYVGVGGGQPRVPIAFVAYGSESDDGFGGVPGYPVPEEAKSQPNFIEGGAPGGGTSGDRHLLVVDRDSWVLFELYAARWNPGANRWEAGSGAVFDLSRDDRRPEGWTSADAAGLAVLPGLVRYDETMSGEIGHALRVTVRSTDGYVWPASHQAGGTPGALPMGARLRLKASTDLSGFPPEAQRIFRAMQTYGLIVADNGSDMYITGTMDPRWNNGVLNPAFRALTADDFEVIQLGWR
jgi:hypothetical protein